MSLSKLVASLEDEANELRMELRCAEESSEEAYQRALVTVLGAWDDNLDLLRRVQKHAEKLPWGLQVALEEGVATQERLRAEFRRTKRR